ncbi:hypothetical protein LC612_31790 [Nostoc sp. CHAB 5834]|nr:hypothetical protein [Nostoc sp. CHAB 5834]
MTLFGVQESLLEFRLGYLGRYWFLAISASLLLSFLLSAPITITLIIKFAVDPFTWTGNVVLSGIAAVIFGVILTLAQWLILRQSEMTPRVFVGTASVSTLYSPIPTPLALIKDNQKSHQSSEFFSQQFYKSFYFLE